MLLNVYLFDLPVTCFLLFTLINRCSDGKPFVPKYEVSKEKVTSLGLEFTPLEVNVRDTIENLKEKGFVNID